MGQRRNGILIQSGKEWPDGSYTSDIEMTAELFGEVKQIAELQHCSISNVIEMALRAYVEELGDLWALDGGEEDEEE